MKQLMAGAVLGVGLLIHTADAGYLNETFEGYLLGTNLSALGTFQWGASDNSVIITNAIGTNGSYLVDLPAATVASNAINVAGGSNRIWTECSLRETYGVDCMTISTNALSGSVAAVAMSTGGYVMVYNPAVTSWLLCTNDVVGSNVQVMALGSWPKVSLCVDYGRHETAVFLNGRLLAQEIPFITNLSTYGMFTYKAGTEGHSYLDDVLVSNAVPATLAAATPVSDSDDDGRADAQEIDQFGSIAVTGRLTIVSSATNSEGGTVTPQGTIAGIKYNGTTNIAFSSAVGYVLDHVWTNRSLAVSYDHQAKSGSFTWAGVVADGTLEVGFYYNGIRYVPNDYGTITGALAAAQAGDRIVVSNAAYTTSITLSNGVMLVGTNMTGTATNLEVRGSLSVVAGATGTVSGVGGFTVTGAVSVAAGGRLVLTNAQAITLSSLSIGSGGSLQVYNGTLQVAGMTFSGNFTLNDQWGTIRASTLNFTDSFDNYADGTTLSQLGWFGWGANSTGAVVQGAVATQGVLSALVPEGVMISNTVSATGAGEHKVWTDFWWREPVHSDDPPEVNPSSAVELYIGTNGLVSIYNNGEWDVCSNDYWGVTNSVGPWATDVWHRLTVFQNFDQTNVAVFLDGRLLRIGVPFINKSVTSYRQFSYAGGGGNAYLDAVKIWTNPPALSDGDGDGIDDGVEIHLFGDTSIWPRGSIFKIR